MSEPKIDPESAGCALMIFALLFGFACILLAIGFSEYLRR
jgi:hypothetical protein